MTPKTTASRPITAILLTLAIFALIPLSDALGKEAAKHVRLRIVIFQDKAEAKATLKEIRKGVIPLALVAKERFKAGGGEDVDEYGYRGKVAIDDLEPRLKRALRKLKEGRTTGVVKLKDKTYAIAEAVEIKYLIRGAAAFLSDDFKKAEPDLIRHIELNPDAFNARLMLGELYFAQDRKAEAAAAYETAGQVDTLAEADYARLGNLYLKMQRLQDARRTFENGLSHYPGSARLDNALDTTYILMISDENVVP